MGPGSSSESHRACDYRNRGSFFRVTDIIGQQILLHNFSRTEGAVVGDIQAIRKAKRTFLTFHDFPELSNFGDAAKKDQMDSTEYKDQPTLTFSRLLRQVPRKATRLKVSFKWQSN